MSDKPHESLSHEALVGRVQFLMERQRYAQALPMLQEGLASHPDSTSLLYYSAFLDWVEDRIDPAQKSVQQLLALSPEHYGGRMLLARLYAERRYFKGAEQLWIALIKDHPEDPDLYAGYGELMLEANDIRKARRLAQEGLRHEPENEQCLYVAAMARLVDGQGLGDNADLATLVARHPERLRSMAMLVVALQDQAKPREALRVAQELLRAEPGNPHVLEMVRSLRAQTHWSMLPLYPLQRWGWPAVFALFAAFFLGLPRIAPALPAGAVRYVTIFWLVYVIYSWVWPPILRKWT